MIAKPTPKARVHKPLRSKPNPIPMRVREEVYERDERTCRWCDVPGGALDLHHRRARSQGGRDELDNLVSLHRLCHGEVHRNPIQARRRGLIVGAGANDAD